MLGAVARYGMMSADKHVFEQELKRRLRRQEAIQAAHGPAGKANGGITRLAAPIRNLVRVGGFVGSGAATSKGDATI